jgi:murein DD-endopeptidase MepM/ murein hydrolase activator NlpD
MNSPYSILVLRGSRMRRFAVAPERLRELVLVGLLLLSFGALMVSDFLLVQRKIVDDVIASGQNQKEKLSALSDRTKEVQATLKRWKEMREKIQASMSQRNQTAIQSRQEGEELNLLLEAIHGELKNMISALPSEWPVQGQVTLGIGIRPSPWTGAPEFHAGLDIPKPMGTPVQASGDAVVESVDNKLGTIVLNHGQEIKTQYAHLSKIHVSPRERVRKGQRIAEVGNTGKSTGPHLHYEVRVAGVAIDPRLSLMAPR